MENLSETNLPSEFSDLQDLVNAFAISDDVGRDCIEQQASAVLRQSLVERLNPRFDAINAYLDTHDDESAHTLGRLAEAACEVAIELSRKQEGNSLRVMPRCHVVARTVGHSFSRAAWVYR